jgi:hypothetical protein
MKAIRRGGFLSRRSALPPTAAENTHAVAAAF